VLTPEQILPDATLWSRHWSYAADSSYAGHPMRSYSFWTTSATTWASLCGSITSSVSQYSLCEAVTAVKWMFYTLDYSVKTLSSGSVGSITSLWYWWTPTAASTLSSTPPSTASSSTASDVWCRSWNWTSSRFKFQPSPEILQSWSGRGSTSPFDMLTQLVTGIMVHNECG